MTPFKTFILSSIILTIIALIVTYGATQLTESIHPATMVTPFVDIEGANVTGEGLIIKLIVSNATGNITITGGYAEILESGQSSSLNVTGPLTLEAVYPLMPQYVNLSTIGIKGLVSGTFYGDPMYIGFFLVAPIHVSISMWVSNVHYNNCLLNMTISYSTPIPIVINSFTNVTLIDDTESEYVFYTIGNISKSILLAPGVNSTSITMNVGEIPNTRVFSCSLTTGHLYTLYLPITVTYIYPTTSITTQLTLYKAFIAGG